MVTTHETLVSTTHTFWPTKQLTNTPPGHPGQPHGALASQKVEMRVWQHCHVTISYQSPKPMARVSMATRSLFLSLSRPSARPPSASARARSLSSLSLARSLVRVVCSLLLLQKFGSLLWSEWNLGFLQLIF